MITKHERVKVNTFSKYIWKCSQKNGGTYPSNQSKVISQEAVIEDKINMLICKYNFMSLAKIKSLALKSIEQVEFINRENSRDDNKAPWGTLDVGENKIKEEPRTKTKKYLFIRYEHIQVNKGSLIPMRYSVLIKRNG